MTKEERDIYLFGGKTSLNAPKIKKGKISSHVQ